MCYFRYLTLNAISNKTKHTWNPEDIQSLTALIHAGGSKCTSRAQNWMRQMQGKEAKARQKSYPIRVLIIWIISSVIFGVICVSLQRLLPWSIDEENRYTRNKHGVRINLLLCDRGCQHGYAGHLMIMSLTVHEHWFLLIVTTNFLESSYNSIKTLFNHVFILSKSFRSSYIFVK